MFKVSFLTEDKKLPSVLHALDGQIYELEIAPVHGAKPRSNGHIVEIPERDFVPDGFGNLLGL